MPNFEVFCDDMQVYTGPFQSMAEYIYEDGIARSRDTGTMSLFRDGAPCRVYVGAIGVNQPPDAEYRIDPCEVYGDDIPDIDTTEDDIQWRKENNPDELQP